MSRWRCLLCRAGVVCYVATPLFAMSRRSCLLCRAGVVCYVAAALIVVSRRCLQSILTSKVDHWRLSRINVQLLSVQFCVHTRAFLVCLSVFHLARVSEEARVCAHKTVQQLYIYPGQSPVKSIPALKELKHFMMAVDP